VSAAKATSCVYGVEDLRIVDTDNDYLIVREQSLGDRCSERQLVEYGTERASSSIEITSALVRCAASPRPRDRITYAGVAVMNRRLSTPIAVSSTMSPNPLELGPTQRCASQPPIERGAQGPAPRRSCRATDRWRQRSTVGAVRGSADLNRSVDAGTPSSATCQVGSSPLATVRRNRSMNAASSRALSAIHEGSAIASDNDGTTTKKLRFEASRSPTHRPTRVLPVPRP